MTRLQYVAASLLLSGGPSLLTGFIAAAAHRNLAVAALCGGAVYALCTRHMLKGCQR